MDDVIFIVTAVLRMRHFVRNEFSIDVTNVLIRDRKNVVIKRMASTDMFHLDIQQKNIEDKTSIKEAKNYVPISMKIKRNENDGLYVSSIVVTGRPWHHLPKISDNPPQDLLDILESIKEL